MWWSGWSGSGRNVIDTETVSRSTSLKTSSYFAEEAMLVCVTAHETGRYEGNIGLY